MADAWSPTLDPEFWRDLRRDSLLGARRLRDARGMVRSQALRLGQMNRAMARHYKTREQQTRAVV